MTNTFPALFSPLRVGPITLKNRIVNSPHQTGFARDGNYTDALLAYHRERAEGGAALIMSQATAVVPGYLDLWNVDDTIVDQYKTVMATVAEYGAHYAAELWHPGRQSDYTGEGTEVYVAPSPVPTSYFGSSWRVPHALLPTEIEEIVTAFGTAAGRCREGGLSGIELHFAHGNLVEQFLSPATNQRTDYWGGSLDNRLRFAYDVLAAVRAAAGPDLAVGARVTGAGLDAGELTDLDMAEIIGTMGTWGFLDYFSVTMGHYSDALNTARNIPNMTFRPGLWGRYGKLVKSVVDVPVFLVGRINHPDVAEELITSGSCDAVVMARGLIADPRFPEKARSGRVEEIRPCVGAMNCLNHLDHGGGIRCIHNPVVGREKAWSGSPPAADPVRRIVVVGGGPAGMECARVASARGHQVTVLERESHLGGQVRAASSAPTRGELAQIVEWLEQQCRRGGVDIRTETAGDRETVARLSPDRVVLATGSTLPVSRFEGASVPALHWQDAIRGRTDGLHRVVIYDEFGDWPAFNVAQALAAKSLHVDFVTPTAFPGSSLELTNWRMAYASLVDLGVHFHPVTDVVATDSSDVIVRPSYGRVTSKLADIDAMVWIGMPRAENALYAELHDLGPVEVIGDAFSPRGIEAGVYDGQRVGRAI